MRDGVALLRRLPRLWLAGVFAGCRGEPPAPAGGLDIAALVDSLRPSVEAAVGLQFRETPRSAMVSKEEVRRYILARLDKEFPPARREGMQAAYRLFGLLPDTLDLEALLLDLYAEQVAGYYDPESSTLYGVIGGDGTQLRLILAHELVHALQHHYLPLDSLMQTKGDGDRTAATQAVLEGHATLASIALLAPGMDVTGNAEFWDSYQEQVRSQQHNMPVFARAPLVLREALIFPYVAGANFMRWWKTSQATPLPGRGELPVSTEQVLHPSRYPADQPVTLRFADSTSEVQFEDTFGELESQILLSVLNGSPLPAYDLALGWGGDRYRVMASSDGPVLVWYSVWDGSAQRDRFLSAARRNFPARERYRVSVDPITLEGKPGLRLLHAPIGWSGSVPDPVLRTQD